MSGPSLVVTNKLEVSKARINRHFQSEYEHRDKDLDNMTTVSDCQYLSCLVLHQTPVYGAYHLAGFVLPDGGSCYEMASG